MARAKDEEFDIETLIIEKLKEPGLDALILLIGAFLGTRGYTPISAMINLSKGLAGAEIRLPEGRAITGAPAFIVRTIAGFVGVPLDQPGIAQESIIDTITKGGIGALEAFALTRPGTVGGILQGIGAIVPL